MQALENIPCFDQRLQIVDLIDCVDQISRNSAVNWLLLSTFTIEHQHIIGFYVSGAVKSKNSNRRSIKLLPLRLSNKPEDWRVERKMKTLDAITCHNCGMHSYKFQTARPTANVEATCLNFLVI